MKIHYLEIVTPELDATCDMYSAVYEITFGEPDPLLGHARTAQMTDGSIVGVRAPMHESEAAVVRPYWLVDDINVAVENAAAQGAVIAHEVMEIPGKGKFAICIIGDNHHGFWQL